MSNFVIRPTYCRQFQIRNSLHQGHPTAPNPSYPAPLEWGGVGEADIKHRLAVISHLATISQVDVPGSRDCGCEKVGVLWANINGDMVNHAYLCLALEDFLCKML